MAKKMRSKSPIKTLLSWLPISVRLPELALNKVIIPIKIIINISNNNYYIIKSAKQIIFFLK